MGYLGYDKIFVRGVEALQTIKELEMCVSPNNHAAMRVTGIIDQKIGAGYIEQILENKTIQILEKSEQEKIVFSGQVIDASIREVNGIFYIEIKGSSSTYKLDLEKKSQSFQDTKVTYEQLIRQVIKDTHSTDAIFEIGEEQEIGIPIIQYRETDWQFIKRMASHFGTSVVPEVTGDVPRFWFGMPEGKDPELLHATEYTTWKDVACFNYMGGQASGYELNDFLFYAAKTWQDFSIGDSVSFKDRIMIVCSKKGNMEKGQWVYTYNLGFPAAVGIKMQYNNIISGMSIEGTVLDTKAERLKVHLDIDKSQNKDTAYWYPYVPTTGNMMYCMPKIGTRVILYFPDQKEENAKITGCVRTNGTQCKDTADPSNRYFTTEHNKQMALLPKVLSFSGIGNEQSPVKITMQEEAEGSIPGITLESHKVIRLIAQGNIEFSSDQKIICLPKSEFHAGKVEDQTPKSMLNIKYEFNMLTKNVNILTTRFESFPPVDDPPPKAFDKGKFWMNLAIGALAVAAIAVVSIATFGVGAVAIGAIAGAAIGVGFKAYNDWNSGTSGPWQDYVAKALGGAVAGAIGSFGESILVCAAFCAGGNLVGSGVEELASKLMGGDVDYSWKDYALSGVCGLVGGAAGYGVGQGVNKAFNYFASQAIKGMSGRSVKQMINGFAAKFGQKCVSEGAEQPVGTIAKKWIMQLTKAYTEGEERVITEFTGKATINATVKQLKGELGENATINAIKKFIKADPQIFLNATQGFRSPWFRAIDLSASAGASEVSSIVDTNGLNAVFGEDPQQTPQDGARYLVRGARLKCSCGSSVRKANLPKCHGTYVKGEPVLCERDNIPQNGPEDSVEGKNIMFFGACTNPNNTNESASYQKVVGKDWKGGDKTVKVDGKKCTPKPMGTWKQAKRDVAINGDYALTTDSWIQCLFGGRIEVEDSGQRIEEAK